MLQDLCVKYLEVHSLEVGGRRPPVEALQFLHGLRLIYVPCQYSRGLLEGVLNLVTGVDCLFLVYEGQVVQRAS